MCRGTQRASQASSGGLLRGSRLSQPPNGRAPARISDRAGGEHPAGDLVGSAPGGPLGGALPGPVRVDGVSGLTSNGDGVEHGADRLSQRRVTARLRIATRCVLLGIEAQHLAPAPAQLQHAGTVVVGGGVRRAPDVAQLAEPVAEDLLHHTGNRGGLAVVEDVGVHPGEHQPRQLGSVGGQPPHLQPMLLLGQVLRHELAPMRGQLTTEEQDHLLTAEVPTQLADELDQRLLVVVAVLRLEVEPSPGVVPAVGEGGGHRDPLPVERMAEDRGLAQVLPRGAQLRRTTGVSEAPLSSLKTIQACFRRASFLSRATPPARATSAGRMPLANSRAACSRHCSKAPRSRRPVPREPLLERLLARDSYPAHFATTATSI
jgi:hypothetical protein